MKKIAFFCPQLTGGGAEKVAGILSKALEPYVDKLYFFILYKEKITYEYGGELVSFNFDQINQNYARYGRLVIFIRKIFAYLHLPKRMRKIKRDLGIECTISFLDFPSIINIMSRANDKIIASIRCPKTPQKQQNVGKISQLRTYICHTLLRKYLNRADVIVPASYGIGEDLAVNFGIKTEKIQVIYNFLNKEKISELKCEEIETEYKDYFENSFTFLCVGRLEREKNLKSILYSFAEISQKNSDAKLVFVGEGTLREYLLQIRKQLNLQNRVLFIPYASNPYKYMAKSNVLISNSFYEGYPNVLIEAMCCGCPPVSVDCLAGPREIIGDMITYTTAINGIQAFPRGILFERGKLQEAMQYVLDNPEKLQKMAECDRLYIQQYSNEEIVRQWMACIGGDAE